MKLLATFIVVLAALFVWGMFILFLTEGLRYFCEICEDDNENNN